MPKYCQGNAGTSFTSLEKFHTHTPGNAGLFYSFSGMQLTKKIQSHVSVFPEFVVHGYVGQEIEDQGVLGQLGIVVV